MKRRTNLTLRRMGRRYMMVNAASAAQDTADVYTLNETAARLWERLGDDEISLPSLASWDSLRRCSGRCHHTGAGMAGVRTDRIG